MDKSLGLTSLQLDLPRSSLLQKLSKKYVKVEKYDVRWKNIISGDVFQDILIYRSN